MLSRLRAWEQQAVRSSPHGEGAIASRCVQMHSVMFRHDKIAEGHISQSVSL